MIEINRVMLVGRLGAPPETKYTTTGVRLCRASIATSRVVANGGRATDWHQLVAFGDVAVELEAFQKGATVGAEGSLTYHTWKVGAERRKSTQILVSRVFTVAITDMPVLTPDHLDEIAPPPEDQWADE